MVETIYCQFLEWDTDFFGCRIARVNGNYLTLDNIGYINDWCNREKIDCLYFLANPEDENSIRLAEANDFHLVDMRVTLEKKITQNPLIEREVAPFVIRPSIPEDIPALRAIAKDSYSDTRFYFDHHFPKTLCDALYETWIEKSCKGFADIVLVAEFANTPVGFITAKKIGEKIGEIGLVGVNVDRQGMGLGRELISASFAWFFDCGIKEARVATQGKNHKAQRLYQRCGFLTKSVQIWYHRWFSQSCW